MPSNTSLVVLDERLVTQGRPAFKKKMGPSIGMNAAYMAPKVEVLNERKNQASIPEQFFRTAMLEDIPVAPGAEVNCRTFHDFLSSIQEITRGESNYPPIDHVKIKYIPGNDAKLFIEGGGLNVWTAVSIDVRPRGDRVFIAKIPLQLAINVMNSLKESNKTAIVGADNERLLIGPYSIPYLEGAEDLPLHPALLPAEVQAIMPRQAIEEICSSVAWARSRDMSHPSLHGILLDFEPWMDTSGPEPEERVVLTAVGMSGQQTNVLRMPHVQIRLAEGRSQSHVPPTITVPAGFFYYLHAVVDGDFTCIEMGDKQISAVGRDYMAIADAYKLGLTRDDGTAPCLSKWRTINVDYEGYWLLEKDKLGKAVEGAMDVPCGDVVSIGVDQRNTLFMIDSSDGVIRYTQGVMARRCNAPQQVNVRVNSRAFLNAISSCKGELVRLGFHPNINNQQSSPITVMGEDEHFKSIIVPTT